MKRRCFIALTAAAGALMTMAVPANAATTHDEYRTCYAASPAENLCYALVSRYIVTNTGSGSTVYSGDAVETWTMTDPTGAVIYDTRTYEYKYHYLHKANDPAYQVYRYVLDDDEYPYQGQICQLHHNFVMVDGEVKHDDADVTCS